MSAAGRTRSLVDVDGATVEDRTTTAADLRAALVARLRSLTGCAALVDAGRLDAAGYALTLADEAGVRLVALGDLYDPRRLLLNLRQAGATITKLPERRARELALAVMLADAVPRSPR